MATPLLGLRVRIGGVAGAREGPGCVDLADRPRQIITFSKPRGLLPRESVWRVRRFTPTGLIAH